MTGQGIELLRFPIVDMDVTSDRDGLRRTLDDVLSRLQAGKSVAVACRGGLGAPARSWGACYAMAASTERRPSP